MDECKPLILGLITAVCDDWNQEHTDVCKYVMFAFVWWGGAG